ncbi:MAG TPA: protein kinase [Thermoanaerobaculia bacterium]|nr:protein kinase [Thermoanaerobaculia bacterium]
MSLPPGTRLGPYEIVNPLGSGGMGDVYRARDTRLDRDVAVKVLPERYVRDSEARMRFEREAKAVAALSHPNILAIHDYGSHENEAYSVTELLEGQTLRRRLIEDGPMAWRKAVEIAAEIADGLAAAHAKGIIHRDLKPENIFLTDDGRVKILDFGLVQLIRPDTKGEEIDASSIPTAPMKTDPSTLMGTAGYMAPEQLRGEPVDATTDIFALGCVLYELVTGRAAFIRGTIIDSLSAILTDTPDVFGATQKMIPYELARVIQRCLEKNRGERFQSARDLAFALRALGTASLTFEAPQERKKRRVIWGSIAIAAIVAITVVYFVKPWSGGLSARRNRVAESHPLHRTLAILPFINATGDREAEYLSDGITETLINTLAQVPGLRVMSRTSVFHYKDRATDPQRVGRELHVSAVVVGRVETIGDRLVVSAELVDANDSSQLWGNRYQTARADLFSVQQSIASEIARMLRLELTSSEQQLLAKRYTTDPRAYELYLKGRFQWNKRDAEGLYKAIEYFNQAIEIDPQYALAYAGLADVYNLLDIWAGLPTRETFPKAKAAAQKALSIDDQLAEAHTSLAYAIHTYEWDWNAAESEYKRAIALNPNYATAHQWYAEFLTAVGRFDDARREGQKALELDPMSPIINAVVGWNETMARRYDAAIAQTRRTTQLFPSFAPGHAYHGLAFLEAGKPREAIAALDKAIAQLDIVVFRTWLIRAHLAAGDRARAERMTRELVQRNEYLPPYYMAALYAHLGDKAKAVAELKRAYAERTGALVWIKVDPAMDPLQNEKNDVARR